MRRSSSGGLVSSLLVSIIVNNHNYDGYVTTAIESALAQTYPHVEVVVVDDGSNDRSRSMIDSFGLRVRAVYTEHGGQSSALNAGWQVATGDVICLLDSDDAFLPGKAAAVAEAFDGSGGARAPFVLCHPLASVDAVGRMHGVLEPLASRRALEGNLYDHARVWGYLPYAGAPTSGISFSRSFGELLFPLPVGVDLLHGADDFVVRTASLISEVRWLDQPLALYRRHGPNASGHGRPRSLEFHAALDSFLNARLVESGREPVIDYHGSSYARSLFVRDARPRALAALAVEISRRTLRPETIASAARTLVQVPMAALRARRNRGRPGADS
jgi:hypothetical protein